MEQVNFNVEFQKHPAMLSIESRTCREIEYEDTGIIICSECGAIHDGDYTQYFCWNCGRKIVN